MARYKPYERYKDSGVEWIGEIPEHWSLTQVNKHFDICLGKMLQPEKQAETDTLEKYLCSINIDSFGLNLDVVKEMWFSSVECSKYEIVQGDLLVCEGGDVGKVAIWDGSINPCYIQNALHRLRPFRDNSNKFLIYWFIFLKTVGYIDMVCNKATMAHFTREKVARTVFIDSPFREQQAIADFLDQRTSELDGLIAYKEKLVTLLQEYRQAIISEAVTKGLNPDVKMKDSGVEWIGEIPEHWEVKRLDFVMSEIRRTVVPRDLRVDNVFHYSIPTLEEIEDGKIEDVSSIESGKLVLSGGELLVSKLNPRKCRVVLTTIKEIPIVCSTEFVAMKPIKCFPRYVTYLYQVDGLRHFFSAQVQSVTRSHQRVRADVISKLKSCLPPIAEQEAIADYLDQKASEVDDLISGIQESIAQHKSYRQSLISEAVTGKIDVRGVI